jgi:hypothetical protein
VDDVPKFLHQSSTHSIYDSQSDFRIPLKLRGIHSGFISHTPSKQELEECRWIELTGEAYWDPGSDTFEKNESIISDQEEGLFVLHDCDILTVSASHLTSATDNAKELTSGGWKKITSEHQIPQTLAEPYSPWQVRAEGAIRELKRGFNRLMERMNAPRSLWDFCTAYVADLRSMTVTDLYSLQGRTPWEIVTGHTLEYTTFAWYDPV